MSGVGLPPSSTSSVSRESERCSEVCRLSATTLVVPLVALSIPYVIWVERYIIDRHDGCRALGAWLMGLDEEVDRPAIAAHLRSWAVKGFFTAFMLAIVPGGFASFVGADWSALSGDPIALSGWLIGAISSDKGYSDACKQSKLIRLKRVRRCTELHRIQL